jgi:hypothetical protein
MGPRTRCLHRYHDVVPLVALTAPFARGARSTNRSTAHCGHHPCRSHNVTVVMPIIPGLAQSGTPFHGSSIDCG